MKVQDVMVNLVELVYAGESVLSAAKTMLEQNVGFLPVASHDRLIGVITDRDIVTRVVADGLDPAETLVDDAMTPGTKYCFEDEDTEQVARSMAALKLCRLPVMNRDRQLVGVVSIDDIAAPGAPGLAGSPPAGLAAT